jgi:hypothetical protein
MPSRIFLGALGIAGAALAAACSDGVTSTRSTPVTIDGRIPAFAAKTPTSRDILPTGKGLDVATDPSPPPRTRNRIEYHPGGPIIPDVQNTYFIWYGSWPSTDPVRSNFQIVMADLASNLCDRPYTDMFRAYTNPDGRAPRGCMFFAGSGVDAFSHGPTLSDADVADVIANQVFTSQMPLDPSGIYFVMASPEIAESSGFGTSYCGWHGRTTVLGFMVHFAFIGWPGRAPTNCAPNGDGPNGNASADAAASHFVALWADMVTDPNYDAWFDKLGLEVADKCVWTYGTTYTAPNGKAANVHLGSRDFLLQQLWVPTKSGGACGLHP